jgi:uncharacterized protein
MGSESKPSKQQIDFEGARDYALSLLENSLGPGMFYHSLPHTRDEVAPAAERLAEMERVNGESLLLLITAAYFHDVGFIRQRMGHEDVGAGIVEQVLPDYGYAPEQIAAIQSIIMATKLPQSPRNLIEEIMADADLDVLGRDDFYPRSMELRDELQLAGVEIGIIDWYRSQLKFLREHQFWTESARKLRDEQKKRNICALEELLAASLEGDGDGKQREG